MKKFTARLLALGIVLALAASLFTGCSGTKQASNASDSKASTAADTKAAATSGSKAATTAESKAAEKITLTYWSDINNKVAATSKSYNELLCYQELEKRTGIHINFQHPPVGQEKEQFNLMIASRNLPDLIWYTWPSIPGGPAKAISDGTIIKLNDQISKNAPNLNKVFEKYPDAKKQSLLDDGSFYMMPFIKPDKNVKSYFGPQIRKDWLAKLNLAEPKTIDDWYKVLKAFKEKDPNGNGKNDELPLVSQVSSGVSSLTYFTAAWGLTYDFYQDNGKVKYGPMEPAYKEFLKTMRQWYKEGLLDPDFASTDGKQFDSKITNDQGGSYFGLLSGNMGRYLSAKKDDTKYDLVGVPWPTGPAGKSYYSHVDLSRAIPGPGMAITTSNKHVAESMKWADYQYGNEGMILMNFGIEGESYKMVNGYPTYTDDILKNPKMSPDQAIAKYTVTFGGTTVYDSRYYEQILTMPQQKTGLKTFAASDSSLILPVITPTTEESSKLANIMNEVNTYRDESIIKFIMGQEPIENFDKYVQNMKSMGIENALKVEQAAFDRYNNRK